MKRSKKAFITLEELVKMIPHIALLLILLFIIVQAYTIFFVKKDTPAMTDLKRIISEIEDLKEGEEITAPILGENYAINKYENNPSIDSECKELCLCVKEKEKTTLCKAVKDKKIADGVDITNQKTLKISYGKEKGIELTT